MTVLLERIARTSVAVAATPGRRAKVELLADCLRVTESVAAASSVSSPPPG